MPSKKKNIKIGYTNGCLQKKSEKSEGEEGLWHCAWRSWGINVYFFGRGGGSCKVKFLAPSLKNN